MDTINKRRKDRWLKKIKKLSKGDDEISLELLERIAPGGDDSNENQELDDTIDYLAAYWKVASKRFTDAVPQILHDVYTRFDGIADTMRRVVDALMAKSDEELGILFLEDNKRKRDRKRLEEKRDRLQTAKERFEM